MPVIAFSGENKIPESPVVLSQSCMRRTISAGMLAPHSTFSPHKHFLPHSGDGSNSTEPDRCSFLITALFFLSRQIIAEVCRVLELVSSHFVAVVICCFLVL